MRPTYQEPSWELFESPESVKNKKEQKNRLNKLGNDQNNYDVILLGEYFVWVLLLGV